MEMLPQFYWLTVACCFRASTTCVWRCCLSSSDSNLLFQDKYYMFMEMSQFYWLPVASCFRASTTCVWSCCLSSSGSNLLFQDKYYMFIDILSQWWWQLPVTSGQALHVYADVATVLLTDSCLLFQSKHYMCMEMLSQLFWQLSVISGQVLHICGDVTVLVTWRSPVVLEHAQHVYGDTFLVLQTDNCLLCPGKCYMFVEMLPQVLPSDSCSLFQSKYIHAHTTCMDGCTAGFQDSDTFQYSNQNGIETHASVIFHQFQHANF